MPYALLIGILIAFTALVPVFGAFIGCAVGSLLIFMINPRQAVLFIIVFLFLQQIEGNLIYPKVVGSSIGLPGIWVLAAIIIGSGLGGVVGMLLGVPVCAVIYMLVKEFIENRLRKRKLPQHTSSYVGNVDYITPDYVCEEPEPIFEEKPEPVEEKPRKKRLRDKVKELHEKISNRNDDDE